MNFPFMIQEPVLLASLVDLQKTQKRRVVSKSVRELALRIQPNSSL